MWWPYIPYDGESDRVHALPKYEKRRPERSSLFFPRVQLGYRFLRYEIYCGLDRLTCQTCNFVYYFPTVGQASRPAAYVNFFFEFALGLSGIRAETVHSPPSKRFIWTFPKPKSMEAKCCVQSR
jgi:hypothetical protein